MNVVVTGARGFVGRNLGVALQTREDVQVAEFDLGDAPHELESALAQADVVFHLAGVNRPQKEEEFAEGNAHFTEQVCETLMRSGRRAKVILTSSIQVELNNAYGKSKLEAEAALRRYAEATGAPAVVYRLRNLFGKWCKPNYNSVTATFCHNIAHELPISISDRSRVLSLTYVDDVIAAFLAELTSSNEPGFCYAAELPATDISLGELADLVLSFREHRQNLRVPDFTSRFVKALYATYLSYLEPPDFAYSLTKRTDPRGSLAEFVKQPSFGQIFVSRTKPGITRGNHYHHLKTEKFLVVEGQAVVRFRHVQGNEVQEFTVDGDEYRVIDIPPGYTHSIENVGHGTLVTLFWASEIFDPNTPDTHGAPVLK